LQRSRIVTDAATRYSGLALANLVLDHWRPVVAVPVVTAILAVALAAGFGREYVAESSFRPQQRDSEMSRFSGLAAQFGIQMGGLGDSESVDFYARLARSPALMQRLALAEYRFARREGGADTLAGTYLDLMQVRGRTPEDRLRKGVAQLQRRIGVGADINSGVVTIRSEAPWVGLAVQLNRGMLNEIDRFNAETRRSQAAAEREFLEARVGEAQLELTEAEEALERFLLQNRRYEAWPELRFEAARLQRRVDLRQQVFTSLAQSYEQARVDEVRNLPILTIIDEPERVPLRKGSLGRTGLFGFLLGGMLVAGLIFLREFARHERRQDPQAYSALTDRLSRGWRRRR
jgi:uncharacterized protein involved in exopolysaccharide biosynthesis